MDLDDLFGPKPIVINLRAKDRWEAIDELIGHLVATNKVKAGHQDAIVAAVKKRESSDEHGNWVWDWSAARHDGFDS